MTRQTQGRGQRYNSILDTVGDTPVVRLNRIAPAHVNMFVKFEAANPAGSVKDRLALNIIEAAEKDGRLKPGQSACPRPAQTFAENSWATAENCVNP